MSGGLLFPLEPKQLLLVAEVPGRGGGDAAERKGATGKNTKKNTKKQIKNKTKNKKIKNGEENSRKYRQQCLQHTRREPKKKKTARKIPESADSSAYSTPERAQKGATREKDAHQHNNNNKNAWYTAVAVVTSTCIVTETQHAVGSKQLSSRTGSRRRPGGSGRPVDPYSTWTQRERDRRTDREGRRR